MKLKPVFLLIAFSLTSIYSQSQNVPLGQWTDYLSYQQGLTVCQGGGNMYCCGPSGVFSYNLSDHSLQRYNKVTGLSDIGCSVARYNPYNNTLVIGYVDGNIDLMTNNQVVNIPDLKNSSVLGSKTINNIYFSSNLAYISCGQGLMVIDMSQDIILDVCNIGPFGSALNINATTILNNDTIFAATDKGIYKISVNDPNIQNYGDWTIDSAHLPKGVYNGIISCGNKLFVSYARHLNTPATYKEDTLFIYSSGKWTRDTAIHQNIYSLDVSTVNNTPYITCAEYANEDILDTTGKSIRHVNSYSFGGSVSPNDGILDNYLNVWIADANYGLVEFFYPYATAQSYFPSGPFSNSIFSVTAQGSTVYVAPGGYIQSDELPLNSGGIGTSEYSNGSWYRLIESSPTDTLLDLCCIAIDPQNPLHAFAGSYGHGIVEYNNYAVTNAYDASNTNNVLSSLSYGSYYSDRIGGVAFDAADNLWAANSNVNTCLVVKEKNNGTWQSFNFLGIPYFPANPITTQLLVTKTGAKWMILPGVGILAYQDNGTFAAPNTSNSVLINEAVDNGSLPSLSIYCMAEDLNGAIWVGTAAQVVVFYSPDDVFNGPGGWDAQNVYVQQTGYTQYLMQGQYTTCIAVDGANRKWIGTLGGGAFLMSADGTQQILNFTSTNSPLLSNNILSIAIDQETGEVFFGTDQGLVSYRGTATEGNAGFSNVYAYPDPVPHGYSGPIAIKNLVTNSDVKIATVNGELVYHTVALGGQAIWYGTNFNGERVQTGVYLVYCTSPDGTQSFVTKLLLIN